MTNTPDLTPDFGVNDQGGGEASSEPWDLRHWLERFSTHLASRNYSVYTIEQRVVVTTAFIDWANSLGIEQSQDVSADLIEAYRMHLFNHRKANGEPLAARTQAVRLVALRAFFKWLAREHIITNDPTARLELPRSER